MSILRSRLEDYLSVNGINSATAPITPDASTREYFRFQRDGESLVACVYPHAIKHLARSYIDVSTLFLENDLPVASIVDFDEVRGVLVIEDLGDRIMRTELQNEQPERKDQVTREAIDLIARIQRSTAAAFASNSIASRLKFDVEKLMWELNYFKIHYFSTFKKEPLEPEADSALDEEFADLSKQLESMATVLCHRDFHAANLMIDASEQLRIIDHQDARIGTQSYDLVSLLLDRVTEIPSDKWLDEMKQYYFEQLASVDLAVPDRGVFEHEFQLQTIQRCLKAAGTFSFQSATRGKTYFIPYIKPMFEIVIRAIDCLGRFPKMRAILTEQTDSKSAAS